MGRRQDFLLITAAAALAAGSAHAQAGASAVGTGSITVLDPAQISQSGELGRGAVVRPRTTAASAVVPGATYTITGASGETFNVTTPAAIALTRAGGVEQLQLTLTPSQTQGVVPGAAGAHGASTVGLSGSVPVAPDAKGGVYVGQYGLTVAYP